MKKLFSVLLYTFCFLSACAQNVRIDSLKILIEKDKPDTAKANHLNALSREFYVSGNLGESQKFAESALSLSEKLGYKQGIAWAIGNEGAVLYSHGDYDAALANYEKALSIDEEQGDKPGIIKRLGSMAAVYRGQGNNTLAHNYYDRAVKIAEESGNKASLNILYGNIGITYEGEGDFVKALDCHLKALKIAQEVGDRNSEARHLGNIGNVYKSQLEFGKALEYLQKALKLDGELGNGLGVARHLSNIGVVYKKQGNYEMALEYYFKAMKRDEENGSTSGIEKNLNNIGNAYREMSAYSKDEKKKQEYLAQADEYFTKSLKIAEELNDKFAVAGLRCNIGTLYADRKNYKEAFNYLFSALALADSLQATELVFQIYDPISALYEISTTPLPDTVGGKLLNAEQMRLRALYYYKRSMAIQEQVINEENKKQLVAKELNFEFEKKSAIMKAEQDKKDSLALAEQKKQQVVLALVCFVLLLVAIVAFVIFRSLHITRRQKNLIEEQKVVVEEKQKEILDSIYYARRIQRSLMPSEKQIEKNLGRLKKR